MRFLKEMKQSQKMLRSNKFKIIGALILWVVLCVSMFKLFIYLIDTKTQNSFSEALAEKVVVNNKIDFDKLLKENNDVIAWIYIENTPINYPVLQSNDNMYYLNKMVNGYYNQCGSIFADYRNSSDFSDNNTIIYGHNMKNGSMFGSLLDFDCESHCKAFLFTPDKTFEIRFLKGLTIENTDEVYNFKNFEFMDENSKYITLSTCINEVKNKRYILIGELIDEDV